MTDDERFEQIVRDAAADYSAPRGEVPRDAMWEAIRARRAAAPAMPLVPTLVPTSAPQHAPRSWVWMGMAATLLLGVAVGRYATTRDSNLEPASAIAPSSGIASGESATPASAGPAAPGERAGPNAPLARPRIHEARPLAGSGSTTYSLVAARHLADVKVLLTSYTASPADARSDVLLAAWAKDLLSNTRLLLDSPAARDPVRARLLADLEVILVQLVQRSPGGDAGERSAVERTLNKNQLIPRLRSAVPAGLHSGTD